MPKVICVSTDDPPTRVTQEEVKQFAEDVFSGRRSNIARLLPVFEHADISARYFTEEREWYGRNHGFAERNELYIKSATKMAASCATKCLASSGIMAQDIDHVIFVSSTGISTPSIDARLFNILEFNPHIKRTPIWGLGCAGGAAGLSRALEYTMAFPDQVVLLIAIELCGLTFQKDDLSKSNLIGTSLFADGSAAALIIGDGYPLPYHHGVNLIGSLSTTYHDSLDVMGWDVADSGLKVIFSKDIPTIIAECLKPNIEEFAARWFLDMKQIRHYVVHPGGMKVIQAYEESLGLHDGTLRFSRKVLREHGNMSSPSVLYVLKEFMESGEYSTGEYGLISALGPGFSSELILFRTS